MKFVELINAAVPPCTAFHVWYPSSPTWLESVQSTVHFAYSCIECSSPHGWAAMSSSGGQLAASAPYLVVLTTTMAEQRSLARDATYASGRHVYAVRSMVIGAGAQRAFVSIIRQKP